MTFTIKDVNNIETDDSVDEVDYYTSIQRAINSGIIDKDSEDIDEIISAYLTERGLK